MIIFVLKIGLNQLDSIKLSLVILSYLKLFYFFIMNQIILRIYITINIEGF